MAVEYPVKIKFNVDDSELKKVKKDVAIGGDGKGGKGGGGKAVGLLSAGVGKLGVIAALLAGLSVILKPMLDAITFLVFFSFGLLIVLIKKMVDGVKAIFSSEFWKKIWEGIKENATQLWEAIKLAFEPIKNAGLWIWENIIKPSWEFLKDVGKWIWNTIIKPSWEFLKDVGKWIWENIIQPSWEYLKDVGLWIWEQILKPAWEFLKDVGLWIWEQIIKPSWDFLSNVGQWIWEQIIKPAFSFLKNIGKWIWDIIATALSKIPGVSIGGRAFGGTVAQDGLYKLHAGESVSRGNTTSTVNNSPNININVTGGGNDELVEMIAQKLTNELNAYTKW